MYINKLLTMSPGIQIYVHQQTAHNVTRYTDICTSTNCSQCHQVYRYMYINKLLTMSPGTLYTDICTSTNFKYYLPLFTFYRLSINLPVYQISSLRLKILQQCRLPKAEGNVQAIPLHRTFRC
jgi:hypothetical protein